MVKIIGLFVLASILLSACNPFAITQKVTGEQGLERLAENTPILLANFIKIDPSIPLEQTIDDVTVRINHFYVNQNTIAIGFIVDSAFGKRYEAGKTLLSYPSGAPIKMNLGTGLNGSSDDLGITLPAGESIFIFFFEDSNNPKISLPFTGKFELSVQEFNLLKQITKRGHEQAVGPFQFEISIPVSEIG